MAIEKFYQLLDQYLIDVKRVSSEASKAYYFLKFIQNTFSGSRIDDFHKLFPYLEKYLSTKSEVLGIRGRADAFIGNVIIEFKDELNDRKLKDAISELKKYYSIIWNNEVEKPNYLMMATDGIQINIYRPNLLQIKLFEDKHSGKILPDRITLQKIGDINLEKSDPDDTYIWLDSYFLTQELRIPTTENILDTFGIKGPVYNTATKILENQWDFFKLDPHISIMYEEWEKYLEIVYGSRIGGLNLFLRHTYLATLSKLMAVIFYSNGAFPSPNEIVKTITGEAFTEWGIQNFLEYDFFSWPVRISNEFTLTFSRLLIDYLRLFDFSKLSEDILKGLYQELIDPEERHDLGEYYTPDWLAELMTLELIENVEGKILDPACGSGTFLICSIKRKIELYEKEKISKNKILEKIVTSVYGIDIHPLAVITCKVNYLLALGDLIRYKEKSVVIPVYLADSIKLPEFDVVLEGIDVYKFNTNGENLLIPKKIVIFEDISNRFFDILKICIDGNKMSQDFIEIIKRDIKLDLTDNDIDVIINLYTTLFKFKTLGKDTIWTYILKNIYKPIFLSENKFDYIIGNPPWISYRYFAGGYQIFLKDEIINKYNLLTSSKVELITHMEFATLFLLKCSSLYLNDEGKIGFVMPRGIFSGDQHDNFRKGIYNSDFGIYKIYDLEKVKPIFKISSCVIFGSKYSKTEYPINGIEFKGKLGKKNASYLEAISILKSDEKQYFLNTIGDRSFLLDKKNEFNLSESYYKSKFNQGATIVPRTFWFVDIIEHELFGIDPKKPFVKTSEHVKNDAKPPYKYVELSGSVEKEFLYASLRGSEILPFNYTKPLIIIGPLVKSKSKYKMINMKELSNYPLGIKYWIENAENKWNELKGKKITENCINWYNYRNKVELQKPDIRYRVLYNTSGTYLASCYFNVSDLLKIKINENEIILNGYIAEHKTYFYETDNEDEAIYLTTILNTPILDQMIKGMQSRGDFGPRDIHKKVLEFPIPEYNQDDERHLQIVDTGKICIKKSKTIVFKLLNKYSSLGHIRSIIRDEIYQDIHSISEIILELLSEQTKEETLDVFLNKQ